MAVDEDMSVECYSVASLPGTSHQELAVAGTSHLIETRSTSRSESYIVPNISNQHLLSRGLLSITPKLEHSLWTRFKPLIQSLEEPLNQYLHIDVAYKGCIQQVKVFQQSLLQDNLTRDQIDRILDNVEKELLRAQYLALWKRGVMLGADKSLYKLTGRKCDPKFENRKCYQFAFFVIGKLNWF
uniref:Uncharacterized protein n=1 Tax=Syphacia muris TaxID=451379 RepID=A0A0N5A9E5_9BILA